MTTTTKKQGSGFKFHHVLLMIGATLLGGLGTYHGVLALSRRLRSSKDGVASVAQPLPSTQDELRALKTQIDLLKQANAAQDKRIDELKNEVGAEAATAPK